MAQFEADLILRFEQIGSSLDDKSGGQVQLEGTKVRVTGEA